MNIEQLYNIYQRFSSVQTDTRKLKKGDLFFALKGDNFNANQFAAKAIEHGAAYAVIDDAAYEIPGKTILVRDVLETLQQLAKYHREQFAIPFIAITGSNGKTTTKELVHAVLSTVFKTYTTEGNLNNHIGIPLTLLKIKTDAQLAVIEMGANHLKEIESYCAYTAPTHGLITNCGKAHLEGFGSIEGVRKGKGELFDYLRANSGTAFIMWDYKYLQEMSTSIPVIIKYGTQEAILTGKVFKNNPFLEVDIIKGMSTSPVKTLLVGEYNLPNVLAAIAIGKFFNVPEAMIKNAIENYSPSNSRSQLVTKGSNTIILDAYNANPSSMKLAIENLAGQECEKKILVLGAMAELGEASTAEHKAIINIIEKYKWNKVVLVGGDFLHIKHPYLQFSSAAETRDWFKEQNIENTHVLIKGSRSMQMEKVIDP